MILGRTITGINKESTPRRVGRKDGYPNWVRQGVVPGLSDDGGQLLPFRGWIRQDTLCDQISVTFLSEATGESARIVDAGHSQTATL